MHRRDLIAIPFVLGAGAAAAQSRTFVVGYLDSGAHDKWSDERSTACRRGLAESAPDLVVRLEMAFAESQYQRLLALAEAFVRSPVDAILAAGLPAALAAKSATRTIPIVFVSGADPVAQGLVQALNRPGGNLTGIAQLFGATGGKRLQLLAQVVPDGLIAILSNPANANSADHLRDLNLSATALGRRLQVFSASSGGDLPGCYRAMTNAGANALLVADDPLFNQERARLIDLAVEHRLPAMYYLRQFVEAGGLMSYGSSSSNNYRLAGGYVGRILKGDSAATLPVLQPTAFEFVLNRRTARSLGLQVPPSVLGIADDLLD
jgi:putative ABC transport system substrate-binding protein